MQCTTANCTLLRPSKAVTAKVKILFHVPYSMLVFFSSGMFAEAHERQRQVGPCCRLCARPGSRVPTYSRVFMLICPQRGCQGSRRRPCPRTGSSSTHAPSRPTREYTAARCLPRLLPSRVLVPCMRAATRDGEEGDLELLLAALGGHGLLEARDLDLHPARRPQHSCSAPPSGPALRPKRNTCGTL